MAWPAAVDSHSAVTSLFNRPSDWIPADLPVRVEFDDFARRFSVTDLVMVSWDGADLDSQQIEEAGRLLKPLCEVETPPASENSMEPGATHHDERLEAASPLDPLAMQMIIDLATKVGKKPLHWVHHGTEIVSQMTASPTKLSRSSAIKRLTGSVVGPNGKQTCLVISLTEAGLLNRRLLFDGIREALSRHLHRQQSEIAMVGGPHDGAVIDEASIQSVHRFAPPSAIVAALLCLFCLRSFVLTAAITIIAVIGEGMVLAAVLYSGTPMNAVLIVLPPLVFVLTVSSGIHLSNYYLDALAEFPAATRAQAAAIAMRAGTLPCLLAASTTVVGLGSLMLVRLEPIRVFGCVATLGLILTLGLLLLILPGTMVLYAGPRHVTDRELLRGNFSPADIRDSLRRRIALLFRRVLRHPTKIIVAIGIATMLLATGLTRLNTSVNMPRMFDADHPLRTQYQWFETHLGPTINGEMLLRFPPAKGNQGVNGNQGAEADPIERLSLIREAHIATARAKDVGGVLSAVTFLPAVPTGKGLSATSSRSVIRAQLADSGSAVGKLGYISRDEKAEVWRISFRLPMTTQQDYGPEIEAIGIAVQQAVTTEATKKGFAVDAIPQVVMTGGVKIAQVAQEILLNDLFTSFLSAFAVVAVVMMLLLRSIVGGLIAMLPNLFPTVWLFGFMGLAEMPLDIGSVMTASVALGIAVDDTIHLLSRFGSRTAKGMGAQRAAWGAMKQCGMAMVHTTLVCGLSLMVYGMSDFVPTRQFAFLMFGLLSVALIGDLFLLPSLMIVRVGRYLAKPVMSDAGAELSDEPSAHPPVDARRLPTEMMPRHQSTTSHDANSRRST